MTDGDATRQERLLTAAALFDVNVLVALALTEHVHHRAAHTFLSDWRGRWATTPMTEAAFYRLLLNPAITARPLAVTDIDAVLRGMRADPRWVFAPDDSTLTHPHIDTSVMVGHSLAPDLHLINLAAVHQMTFATFDRRLALQLAPRDRHHVTLIPAGVHP